MRQGIDPVSGKFAAKTVNFVTKLEKQSGVEGSASA
jgi:hypothetical protein